MLLPVIFLLLFGMVELGRVAFTYYTLEKTMYTLARFLGTQQGVNFCDDADAQVVAAKSYALTGTLDNSADPYIANVTADMISVRIERFNANTGDLAPCECATTGCDAAAGGLSPDFIVVSLPDGYPLRVNIPFIGALDPIPLRPHVRVPYGGT